MKEATETSKESKSYAMSTFDIFIPLLSSDYLQFSIGFWSCRESTRRRSVLGPKRQVFTPSALLDPAGAQMQAHTIIRPKIHAFSPLSLATSPYTVKTYDKKTEAKKSRLKIVENHEKNIRTSQGIRENLRNSSTSAPENAMSYLTSPPKSGSLVTIYTLRLSVQSWVPGSSWAAVPPKVFLGFLFVIRP